MPLDFGQNRFQSPRGRRPPPDYLSRRVQWKIMLLLGTFALVIFLMREVRQPGALRWIENLAGDKRVQSEPNVDTRLRMPGTASGSGAETGPLVIRNDQASDEATNAEPGAPKAGLTQLLPLEEARRAIWSNLLERLTEEERIVFLKALKAARDKTALPDEVRAVWPGLINVAATVWQEYIDGASQAASKEDTDLTDEERQAWVAVLEELRREWSEKVEPMLRGVADADQRTTEHQQMAVSVQHVLDGIFLEAVADNTLYRGAEHDAWFRLLEQLKNRDAEDLRRSSVGPVSFLQLYRQPSDYRGKLVTVRGYIYLGEHVTAPENIYGIESYYIFWVRPSGARSPVMVYSLFVPDGFPDLTKIEGTGKAPVLDEEVEFTGFFFKRRAYRAQDATRLAPVVLAKTPRWQPSAETARPSDELPGPLFWSLLLGGTAVFGIGCAVIVYWLSRRPSPYQAALTRLEGALEEHVDR